MLFFSACSNKLIYTNEQREIYKERKLVVKRRMETPIPKGMTFEQFKEKTKNIMCDGYNIKFLKIKPYLKSATDGAAPHQVIGLGPSISWARGQGLISRSKYRDKYSFMIFPLNQDPYNEKLKQYFNVINQTYKTKVNSKSINKFVNYPCDKNIIFSEYERDENYQPLKATCYAKRLEKDVFLITRFAHPNTQDDAKLFKNKIIPIMLKNIKVTPTKLSPWKYW
jgi:hypothetical protein